MHGDQLPRRESSQAVQSMVACTIRGMPTLKADPSDPSQVTWDCRVSKLLGVLRHSRRWPGGSCAVAVQALAGETRQVLNTVRPKITRFCMLSERNSGSNWVAALLQVWLLDAHAICFCIGFRLEPAVRMSCSLAVHMDVQSSGSQCTVLWSCAGEL